MAQIIKDRCQCGEVIFIELDCANASRRDGKRAFYPDSEHARRSNQLRCRSCGRWIADSVPLAAYELASCGAGLMRGTVIGEPLNGAVSVSRVNMNDTADLPTAEQLKWLSDVDMCFLVDYIERNTIFDSQLTRILLELGIIKAREMLAERSMPVQKDNQR